MSPMELFPLVVAITFSAVVAVVALISHAIRKVRMARIEAYSKLIDKIGSSQEFSSFLETESGKQLMASLALDQPRRDPYSRILASVRAGVILLVLGIAFLILASHFANVAEGFFILGGLGVALGAGFLLSGLISYRLSKKFGLFDRERTIGKLGD